MPLTPPIRLVGLVLAVVTGLALLAVPQARAADTGDPGAGAQWHLDQVQVPLAWDRARGDGVTVAVLDTGITPGPDLRCRRFVAEYDALSRREGPVEDLSGHGTHVAGTIAQCSGNGTGGAGVAPDVDLMDVRVLRDFDGGAAMGSSQAVADGILFAAENGADIINLAIAATCPPQNPTFEQGCSFGNINRAIAIADALGVTILAAAGNDGTGRVSYPANHPDVIAVGSTDASLGVPSYSNRGAPLDHVAAGGVGRDTDRDGTTDAVFQEWFDPDRGSHRTLGLFGTSHAVAHSSGVAALLLSADPSLSPDEVRDLLNDTACDLGTDGRDDRSGAGVLRGANAVEAAVTGIGRGTCFLDVEPGDTFFVPVSEFARRGLTSGCTDNNNRYCPDRDLSRGEMAAFLDRALDLPATSRDFFDDDEDSIFEGNVNRLAAAGITDGCNPPANTRFCPGDDITRGQMAKFLDRGFAPRATSRDFFGDDGSSIFEASINRIAADGITLGCNPPRNTRFCPGGDVSRGQMAAFIVRALD